MEDSPRLKPRLFQGVFRPSLASCSSRTLSDVVDRSFLLSRRRNSFHTFPLSMCRPISPIEPTSNRTGPTPIPKASEDTSATVFTIGDVLKGRICPTAPVASPINHSFHKLDNKKKHKYDSSRFEDKWFSSEDEKEDDDESDTFFSSRSLSSDSSESNHQRNSAHRTRRSQSGVGILPMGTDDGKNIKGSFAVVKKSSDPHGDFRRSMVEMIVEKEMFKAKELEGLLHCFLALNSHHHHKVIVEVFTEIYEALFPE